MALRTQRKRRRENKTDYRARFGLLKSGLKRIAIRRTNKYFIVQVIESDQSKDKILVGVNSKELLNNGWDVKFKNSLKSVPAGYLTGLLIAKKIKESKLDKEDFILDIGMARKLKGNRIFSVAKGIIDAGINLRADKVIFPSDERAQGEHLKPELKSVIEGVKNKLL